MHEKLLVARKYYFLINVELSPGLARVNNVQISIFTLFHDEWMDTTYCLFLTLTLCTSSQLSHHKNVIICAVAFNFRRYLQTSTVTLAKGRLFIVILGKQIMILWLN